MNDSTEPVTYATALYRAGRFEQCLAYCAESPALSQSTPKLLVLQALSLISLGRLDEARRITAAPLFAAAAGAFALAEIGSALEGRGEDEEALRYYSDALRLVPTSADFLVARACLLQKLGRVSKALVDLDAAVRLDPGNEERLLMRLAFHLDSGRLAEAVENGRTLGKERPELSRTIAELLFFGVPIMRLRRAQNEWAKGRVEESIRQCDEVLREYPHSAAAMTIKGFCLYSSEKMEDARAILEEAVRLAPNASLPLKRLGMVIHRLGDFVRARALFDRALAIEPGDAESLFGRAEAKLASGDRAGALADWRAAARDPEWRDLAEKALRDAEPK